MDQPVNFSTISIIMPAYNAEKYIEASILSVIQQTYTDWELLIINDGSVDNTLAIANKYAKVDSRIKVITQHNQRLGAARNTGFKHASGGWIGFLDSDDLWDQNKLLRQIELSKKHPEVDVIYSKGRIFNGDDIEVTTPYPTISGLFTAQQMYENLYERNFIPVLAVIAKKSAIDKNGNQQTDPVFYGCEDWDFWIRMALGGNVFYGIDEDLFFYRRHDNNMSSNSLRMQVAQAAVMLKNFTDLFKNTSKIKSQLKNLINPLISNLIVENKRDDALYLLNGMAKVGYKPSYKLRAFLVYTMGRFSVYPVRAIAKIESMV